MLFDQFHSALTESVSLNASLTNPSPSSMIGLYDLTTQLVIANDLESR